MKVWKLVLAHRAKKTKWCPGRTVRAIRSCCCCYYYYYCCCRCCFYLACRLDCRAQTLSFLDEFFIYKNIHYNDSFHSQIILWTATGSLVVHLKLFKLICSSVSSPFRRCSYPATPASRKPFNVFCAGGPDETFGNYNLSVWWKFWCHSFSHHGHLSISNGVTI